MGVGVVEKGAGSVGPAWQWKEGRAAASRRWAPFRKGKLFTGPSEMELDWALLSMGFRPRVMKIQSGLGSIFAFLYLGWNSIAVWKNLQSLAFVFESKYIQIQVYV